MIMRHGHITDRNLAAAEAEYRQQLAGVDPESYVGTILRAALREVAEARTRVDRRGHPLGLLEDRVRVKGRAA